MKRLYKNILYFLSPIVALLLFLPTDKYLKYKGLEDDCFQHGQWIHDRLYKQSKPVDIAFLGSSHTLNGIDDQLIEAQLAHHRLSVANFGYCRLGRNLSYVLLKEILQQKQLRTLVLEVREDEDRYSHPIFPYLADTRDVVFAHPLFNKDLASDMQTHLSYKVELQQDDWYGPLAKNQRHQGAFGFSPLQDTAALETLAGNAKEEEQPDPSSLERRFYMQYPRAYLNKIHQLCRSNKIQLVFLYLPAYASVQQKPKEIDRYSSYGTVLIPPKTLLADPDYWFDSEHVNATGAHVLSLWVSQQLDGLQ
ncbi:MAG: hypothetical protein AAF990_06535 [Bacteroidota bacterium]